MYFERHFKNIFSNFDKLTPRVSVAVIRPGYKNIQNLWSHVTRFYQGLLSRSFYIKRPWVRGWVVTRWGAGAQEIIGFRFVHSILNRRRWPQNTILMSYRISSQMLIIIRISTRYPQESDTIEIISLFLKRSLKRACSGGH